MRDDIADLLGEIDLLCDELEQLQRRRQIRVTVSESDLIYAWICILILEFRKKYNHPMWPFIVCLVSKMMDRFFCSFQKAVTCRMQPTEAGASSSCH